MTGQIEATLDFVLVPPRQVVSASDNIDALLGCTAIQFLSSAVLLEDLVHADDRDVLEQLFGVDQTTSQGQFNIRLRHADGRIRCIMGAYSRKRHSDGQPMVALRLKDAKANYQNSDAHTLTADFAAMMENTDDFIYFKDCQHVFTGASQTLVSITHPSEHWRDLVGKTDYDVFPEEFADQYHRLEKQVFAGVSVAREVQAFQTNDGRKGWVDNRKYPIKNEVGDIVGLFGIARDITDQIRTEKALIDSERRLQNIFEQVPSVSVQGYDKDRRVIFWNRASEKLYGYSREGALGRKLEDLIIPAPMRDAVVGMVSDWAAGGAPIPAGPLTLQDAQGDPVDVFSSHVMQLGPTGESEMYCLDIDISERRAAETALRASENFLRTIIDEIPDPIVLKDHNGDFLLCNRTVADLYGTTPQAMVGKNDSDFGVPKEMADFFRDNVLGIMARGETQTVFEDSQDAITGKVRHYRSIKKPLKDAQGNNQILVVAQDITEVIVAQKQVAESERRLQQVMEITREGIWDWHIPSGVVIHNAQWYKSLKLEPTDIPQTVASFASLVHPDDKEAVWQRLELLLGGSKDTYFSEHRLLRQDGKTIWVQDRGRIVEVDAQNKPVRVIGSFTDISYQREHQQHLEHIAHYDALTGLPNRVLLADRMHQAMVQTRRRGQQLVTAYLDLDGFKTINDHHGHSVGDQLLAALAAQFKTTLREGDTIARLGGDEFVAVFVDLPDVKSCIPLILRLLEVASRPVCIGEMVLQVSASIGITVYPQPEEADADQLLRQADQAMYQAKLAGRGRYHLFDTEHDRTVRVRHEILQRLREALNRHEFVLHYQPMVNLRTGEVIGAEALVRWQHPERGLLAPATFLPDIEGHVLSIALGEWVLETALAQIETLNALGLDLQVSVNMSAHQLQQPDFPARLRVMLANHTRVRYGQLKLEVLETSALEDIDSVSNVIHACADMGVAFALDDFGTGYSSLTYLKRLPVQVLKIDQSFVRDMLDDPEDLAILEGVLGLALAFRRQAIAEGVETLAHCELLLRMGCDWVQGYGIARPMAADKLPGWISSWRPDPTWKTMPAVQRADLPLVYAVVEHRVWASGVEAYLRGKTDLHPTLNEKHCKLGLWLAGNGRARYGENPAYPKVESTHQQAHDYVASLLRQQERGDMPDLEADLVHLHKLRDELARQLMSLL